MNKRTALIMRSSVSLFVFLGVFFSFGQTGYQRPPSILAKLIEAPQTPSVMFNKDATWVLIMDRSGYPSIEEVSAPELRIGGIRINPQNNGRSRSSYLRSLSAQNVSTGEKWTFQGMPSNPRIQSVSWSKDESKIAFTHATNTSIELWIADMKTRQAKKIMSGVNRAFVAPFTWVSNDQLLVSSVKDNRGKAPVAPIAPNGPVIQETSGQKAPSRTYQDLLKNTFDAQLFEFYTTVQLKLVSVSGTKKNLGKAAIIKRYSVSPNSEYIIVESIQKPFSYLVPAYRFPFNYEVWDMSGKLVKTMAEIPLDEVRPIGFDATRKGMRSLSWRSDKPATLYWTEANDGGNPKLDVLERDIIYTVDAPFSAKPTKLATTSLRYQSISWGDDTRAIINERWWAERIEKRVLINPSMPGKEGVVLVERSTQDHYSNPGIPLMKKNMYGKDVLRIEKGQLFMSAPGGSPEGDRPFLSKFNLKTKEQTILFRSENPYYERFTHVYSAKWDKIITVRESVKEVPNYYIRDLKKGTLTQITKFQHPQPELKDVKKQIVKYKRADAVDLSAVLYTPPGYDKDRDGRLPVLIWAYPREYRSVKTAAQVKGSPYRFIRVSSGSPLFWVLRGYAVMERTEMPIVGVGDDLPNNTFREQLVMNAEAAIDKVVDMGIGDRDRIGIGGHSYGAFMTANLLAHSDLFAAGIARSGAYNRTLTPFGFQQEERSYWEAPELYHYMSPFMHADKVNEPILLIHGEADNNSGTFPIQSKRFYNAIKGHGGTARLTMLPAESHGYRGKESILHMLWEMDTWLEKYVKNGGKEMIPQKKD